MLYKRFLALILAILVAICMVGCGDEEKPDDNNNQEEITENLYVDVIDVGQGDSILITFPDGTNLMIDCGNGGDYANQKIEETFIKRKTEKIDVLVLTHPDSDHVGGTNFVLDKVGVDKAYLPFIYYLENFPIYKTAVDSLVEKGTNTAYSSTNMQITAEDGSYVIKFLSPAHKDHLESSYNQINRYNPTDTQTNNVSPIIYVECDGVRMLFTGDAETSQEEYVLANYKSGLYSGENDINLYDIDLLKVAHHGSSDSSSSDFLNLLKPKHAVFSVGGDNIYGHPSSITIERVIIANENCNIYRTDYLGTISFTIKDGEFTTI